MTQPEILSPEKLQEIRRNWRLALEAHANLYGVQSLFDHIDALQQKLEESERDRNLYKAAVQCGAGLQVTVCTKCADAGERAKSREAEAEAYRAELAKEKDRTVSARNLIEKMAVDSQAKVNEIVSLKAQLSPWNYEPAWRSAVARADELAAENKRLRDALEKVVETHKDQVSHLDGNRCATCRVAWEALADAALSPVAEKQEPVVERTPCQHKYDSPPSRWCYLCECWIPVGPDAELSRLRKIEERWNRVVREAVSYSPKGGKP